MTKALLSAAIFLAFSSAAYAGCQRPSAPDIPDPNSAVTAQMIKAQKEVKAFIAEAKDYLKCVRRASDHNSMVDEMESVANHFNQSIRVYKQRMGNNA